MVFFPLSTDRHNGKIGLAAVEIVCICIIVHIFVFVNISRIEKKIDSIRERFSEGLQKELVQKAPRTIEEIDRLIEDSYRRSDIGYRIDSLRQSSLIYQLGFIPAQFNFLDLVTSLFVHASWMHLLLNLLFFYVCGVAMEKYWGFWRFWLAYMLCGFAACLAYMTGVSSSDIASMNAPLVGASGAIAGAMGAFMVTHSTSKINIFYFIFIRLGTFRLKAWIYFGFWFVSQLFWAIFDTGARSGVAYMAHVGGFLMGCLLGWALRSYDAAAVVRGHVRVPSNRPLQRRTMTKIMEPQAFSSHRIRQRNFTENTVLGSSPLPSLTVIAWEAFQQGNFAKASAYIARGLDNLFQSPESCKDQIIDTIDNIFRYNTSLHFDAMQWYQWGKNLAGLDMRNRAIRCFDFAAQKAKNLHIQTNAMFHAAQYRVALGIDPEIARDQFLHVVANEPSGILAKQAKEQLERLNHNQ